MVTTYPAAVLASSPAHNGADDAALDNALRDLAPDAKPDGTPRCKSACTNVHGQSRKVHNNQADHRPASKNLRPPMLGAGPRLATSRQLTLSVAYRAVADSVVIVPADAACRSHSHDTAGSPANAASTAPRADTIRSNTALADAVAKTAARSP
jgi:hypothetical protein